MSARDDDDGDGAGPEPSYIDYETFLAPEFRPASFANGLVLATNNAGDLPLDLSTPLSRVLFDAQEVDSHIETLTAREAIPLLEYTRSQTEASARIVAGLDGPIRALNESYAQLEKKVTDKYAEADEVRRVATRLWETLRLSTAAARCLALGRQLEVQHAEAAGSASAAPSMTTTPKKEDHRALVRCAHTILSLREILDRTEPGQEGHGLNRVEAIRSLREGVVTPIETAVRDAARRLVREFAVSATATFSQSEETRARVMSGLVTLYLLSPVSPGTKPDKWTPKLLLEALEEYVRSALQASIRELARALGQLPTLDRALADVEARCQNVVALEAVLDAARAPEHPLLPPAPAPSSSGISHRSGNLLQPLLGYLETGSLVSYFWRSMASSLATRVAELVAKGGAPARTLRSNRAAVGEAVRGCVLRGCRTPGAVAELGGKVRAGRADGSAAAAGNWEREAAVMVGSVVNNLGR